MKIPPVIQLLGFAFLSWLLVRYIVFVPMALPTVLPFLVSVIGIVFLVLAILNFRTHETTVNPLEPSKTSALVTSGIYSITRNPMYVGMLFLLLAWDFWLGDLSSLISVPVFVFTMTKFQIKPEEDALTQLFGDPYRQYKNRVNRWLLF